jgi:type II secretory pathway component PulF
LLRAIEDLYTTSPNPVSRRFLKCRDFMLSGMPFWEAVQKDAFFSSAVIFTLRRGEEMARLDEYSFNLSEYFNKRVAIKVDRSIQLIQPLFLVLGGLFLVMIASAFLVPIYGSLTKIAGG